MEVIEYSKEYKEDFIALNKSWIERFFSIEENDLELFENIDSLIKSGKAMVFFALNDGKVVATCMARNVNGDEWEIEKLAAISQGTGKGAGSLVFKRARDWALEHGAKRIILVSNTILKPALHIYEKYGFKVIPLDKKFFGYERGNIEYEYKAE